MAGARALLRSLLAAHLRDRRGLSPATSRTGPIRPGASSSSCWRSSPRPPRRTACSGGPPSIATTTSIPTRSKTRIRRAGTASSTRTSAGSSIAKHAETDLVLVADLAAFPELVWLHRFEHAPAVLTAVACFLIAGWPGLVVGFLWSTVLVYHATFCINSLAHVHGRKRYVTGDDSRNNWLAGALHHGRGLAQQPPRLPEQRAAGLPLVGGGRDLLHPERALLDRAWSGT